MLRVRSDDVTGEITEEYTGSHVILSVEEYNNLVRKLNCLTQLVATIVQDVKPELKSSKFYDGIFRFNIVTTEE